MRLTSPRSRSGSDMRMSRRRASTTGAKPDLRTARRLELGTLTEVASRNGIITAARRSAAKALISAINGLTHQPLTAQLMSRKRGLIMTHSYIWHDRFFGKQIEL